MRILLAALAVLASACDRPEAPAATDARQGLAVSVSGGRIEAPDTVEAGWVPLRVEEDDAGHLLVVFRLADGASGAEVDAFRAALDTARMTPAGGRALGGPEVGDTGTVVVGLEPGRHLLACLGRGADGHRHASTGEARLLVVVPARSPAAPPVPTQEVRMVDFAYGAEPAWTAGEHLVRLENGGRQDHHLRIDRLAPGATLADWLADEDGGVGEPVSGVARMGPGETAYLPVDLAPGEYVLYCLVPEAASGAPHAMMGMFRAVSVR